MDRWVLGADGYRPSMEIVDRLLDERLQGDER